MPIDMDVTAPTALTREPVTEELQDSKRQRVSALVQDIELRVIAGLAVCELAVCEENDDQEDALPVRRLGMLGGGEHMYIYIYVYIYIYMYYSQNGY